MSIQKPSADDPYPLDILSPKAARKKAGDLSESTVWRLRRLGLFPEPVELSPGRKGYVRAEIEAWLARRVRKA